MRTRRSSLTTPALRRVAIRGLRAATLVLGAAVTLRAQDTEPDRLARLDANSRYVIQVLMDSAESAGLPSSALRSIHPHPPR